MKPTESLKEKLYNKIIGRTKPGNISRLFRCAAVAVAGRPRRPGEYSKS